MPFHRERYPKDWPVISRRIRERDGNRCKWCGVPNGALIVRSSVDPSIWQDSTVEGAWMEDGQFAESKPVTVVLTVAHIDHDANNCADDNLTALCQRCHLRHDARQHATNAAETRRRRKVESGQLELTA